jgi:serine/threonine-protein kinase
MPDAVWQVVQQCMDKRPGRRPTARELAIALRVVARQTRDEPALPPSDIEDRLTTLHPPAPRRPMSSSRGRVVALAGVLLTLALIALPAWHFLTNGARSSDTAGVHATPAPAAPAEPPAPHGSPSGGATRSSGMLRAGDKSAIPSAAGPQVEASVVFGPELCADSYTWDLGHPVLAQPCHAVAADRIRMIGHMQGLPGVQADVFMSIIDADSGVLADGPHQCAGLMFTDFAPGHDCGPFEARLPRGHRYVVVQKWMYSGRAILPGGEVRGQEFDW